MVNNKKNIKTEIYGYDEKNLNQSLMINYKILIYIQMSITPQSVFSKKLNNNNI